MVIKKETEETQKKPEENQTPQQPSVIEVPVFLTEADFNKMTYLNHLLLNELNTKIDQILKIANEESK